MMLSSLPYGEKTCEYGSVNFEKPVIPQEGEGWEYHHKGTTTGFHAI